jgi:V/A-type H+-transporting ATPase subunit D
MAQKIQYNKTYLQYLKRQLAVRKKVLPTLKSKETALRIEVKKVSIKLDALKDEKAAFLKELEQTLPYWTDFPDILRVKNIITKEKNTAGTKIPVLENIDFQTRSFMDFDQPMWLLKGLELLKKHISFDIREKILQQEHDLLYRARKKTTQKVNLYEKVQIPAFERGISSIKRFLEDKENIAKAAQKIVKERNARKEVEI